MAEVRVLHIVGAMNRGGTETLLMELYRHIDRTKIQFDFFIYNYSEQPGAYDEEILSLGGRIYNAKRRFYRGPIAYCKELRDFFSAHPEYPIVHAHQYKMSGYMLAMAKKCKVKTTIAHSHIAFHMTDLLRGCADYVGKKLLVANTDYYFGCSEDAVIELADKYSDNETRFVLKNAIDSEKFSFSNEKRALWRKNLGASDSTFVLGNVARFTYQKNHEHLLRVFAEVLKDKEDGLLILVGVGSKEQETKELARKLGVENKVLFMGSRGDVNDIVNAFDIFVMPSRYEGLGIVLIEAQANGLPCVISADVIPDEADVQAGLVTRVSLQQTVREWAEACIKCCKRMEPESAKAAVEKAGYDIKKVAKWLEDFYISCMNGE